MLLRKQLGLLKLGVCMAQEVQIADVFRIASNNQLY